MFSKINWRCRWDMAWIIKCVVCRDAAIHFVFGSERPVAIFFAAYIPAGIKIPRSLSSSHQENIHSHWPHNSFLLIPSRDSSSIFSVHFIRACSVGEPCGLLGCRGEWLKLRDRRWRSRSLWSGWFCMVKITSPIVNKLAVVDPEKFIRYISVFATILISKDVWQPERRGINHQVK